jgi:hypothetical protein
MPIVDINDRSSLEHAYPLASFEHDAAQNARADATDVHGVRINSDVDAEGRFEMIAATRSVAAASPDEDALFLVPYRSNGPPPCPRHVPAMAARRPSRRPARPRRAATTRRSSPASSRRRALPDCRGRSVCTRTG